MTDKMVQTDLGIPNIFMMSYEKSLHDFELLKGTISIFRGYNWPFLKSMKTHHYEILSQTYRNKGLIRKCTEHQGNFEMIGKRRSKQSNGTMFCHPKNVDKHQYYRESMNSFLLPYVRSMVNVLREEALYTNYSSGE